MNPVRHGSRLDGFKPDREAHLAQDRALESLPE